MSLRRGGSLRPETRRVRSPPGCEPMELPDTSLPVVVLHMEHHGALGVMRSLGRLGVRMYGVHSTRHSPASFSKYCRKAYALDLDGTPSEQSVNRLREIARSIGTRPLLLPTNDES